MNSPRESITVRSSKLFVLTVTALMALAIFSQLATGQQTLGSLNGTVTDDSGAMEPKSTVKIRNVAPHLEVTAESKNDGSFRFPDPDIGAYGKAFTDKGFKTAVYNQILVQ